MTEITQLLKGAVDLHVHAGPSVTAREIDAAELLMENAKAGFKACVVKDHYFPTMMSATIAQKHIANTGGTKIYGGIVLNRSVGGINIAAVDAACGMGAKFIWMPTVSAKNHIVHSSKGTKFPTAAGLKLPEKPIITINKEGVLDKKVSEVLEYISGTDMILGTGHGSRLEVDALVTEACRLGVKRLLVNHPQYMVEATMADIKKWAGMGAYIELNAVVYVPESAFGVVPMENAAKVIKEIDHNFIIIDSDYGQKNNGSPVTGIKRFIEILMKQYAVPESEIVKMINTNPTKLL